MKKTAPADCQGEAGQLPYAGKLIRCLSHQLGRKSLLERTDCGGLTTAQKHVLQFILMRSMEGDVYQREVEEEFQIRRSTATGILKLMEQKGFICRESVEQDGRLKRIVPTEKALGLRTGIIQDIRRREAKLREGIPEDEYRICIEVLQKMLSNISGKASEREEDMTGR